MYVLQTRISPNGFHYGMLREMRSGELARDMLDHAVAVGNGSMTFEVVPWEYAHRWVLTGGSHETPLYVDDTGRVRRASAPVTSDRD